AKYVINANVKSTATGFKIKNDNDSENPSFKELQMKSDQANSMAMVYECDIKTYLFHNRVLYPVIDQAINVSGCANACGSIWKDSLFYNNKGGSRSRITAVG